LTFDFLSIEEVRFLANVVSVAAFLHQEMEVSVLENDSLFEPQAAFRETRTLVLQPLFHLGLKRRLTTVKL
jgi:hypothetical protein